MEYAILGVLAFVTGASVGSFLNVVADRLPAGRSLVTPRSYCDNCKRPLASIDMVPIFSFLWLRGKCRRCRAPIPARLMLVELTNGLLFAIVYARHGFGVEFFILCAAVSLLLAVAIIDLEHHLILNRMVFPGIAVLIVLAPFWTELGFSRTFLDNQSMVASFANSLLAGGGAFLVFLVILLAYPPGMGEGDVKLAGLIGLLVGFPQVLVALWFSVISGGLAAVLLLLLRRKGRRDVIPFGLFMSLGTIVALLAGNEIVSWYVGLSANLGGSTS